MSDIRKLFPGYRWRWTQDHQAGQHFDPYHVEIPGRYGTVYLHGTKGGTTLQAYSGRRGVFARLTAIPGVTIWQRGTDEMTAKFRVKDAPAVFAVLRSHRKPLSGTVPPRPFHRKPTLEGEAKP